MNSKTALTKEVDSTSATALPTEEERNDPPRRTRHHHETGGSTTQEGGEQQTHDSFSHTKTKGL